MLLVVAMRHRNESGFLTLEWVIVAPVVLALIGLSYATARVVSAQIIVNQAAQSAAQAASRARSSAFSQAAAKAAAQSDLAEHVTCSPMHMTLSGNFAPGAVIRVAISCTTSLGLLPGSYSATASAADLVPAYFGVGS
jgi:Flp pilus assembly protein TadG